MRSILAKVLSFLALGLLAVAQTLAQTPNAGPYKVLKTAKVGGEGGYDYIFADVEGRRLYVPRGRQSGLTVFNLDTLEAAGTIPSLAAGGATVDPKSHHGFSTTKPITMWDSKTLQIIKTIDVDGRPDGILCDPFNQRVWILSHQPPYATVIDTKEGNVVGTLDLGGAPEQAASDGKGKLYINISDKANIAVVDAKTMTVTAHYDMSSKGSGGSGLAAHSGEVDQRSSAKPITVPAIPIEVIGAKRRWRLDCAEGDRNRQGEPDPERSGGWV